MGPDNHKREGWIGADAIIIGLSQRYSHDGENRDADRGPLDPNCN